MAGSPGSADPRLLAQLEAAKAAVAENDFELALKLLGAAGDLAPEDPVVAFRRGSVLSTLGRWTDAAEAFALAARNRPDWAEAHANLGVARRAAGQRALALESYDIALTLRPDDTTIKVMRGRLLLDLARPSDALADFEGALAGRAQDAELHFLCGQALTILGRHEEAADCYGNANRLRPDWPTGLIAQGVSLRHTRRFEDALACFTAAAAAAPGAELALRHQANALIDLRRHDEALAILDRVLQMSPNVDSFVRKGLVLQREGRHAQALEAFQRALDLDPQSSETRFLASPSLLAQARFEEGWAEFEHRWRTSTFTDIGAGKLSSDLRARLRLWPTSTELKGVNCLVCGEQGAGDVIMFASVLPDLAADAAGISVLVEPRLRRLFRASFPEGEVLEAPPGASALQTFDAVIAIGSLPHAYRRTPSDCPGAPYLRVSREARSAASELLGPRARPFRVGLSWRGGTALTASEQRSIPLMALKPLFKIEEVEFVSLQYGDVAAEIADARGAGLNLRALPAASISDFEDLAAVVSGMDMVISVQTTLIHLAGGLGADCLVLVPHVAEWRYGASGESMPWYRSVRLLRQGPDRQWSTVINEAVRRLKNTLRA